MRLEFKNSLSLKLLRVVLLSALAVGGVISCAQIVLNAYEARQTLEHDAQRVLLMVRDPSTQALYNLDRDMALQVINGLFQNDSVSQASIGNPNSELLAQKSRPLKDTSYRWLTDYILGEERTFTIPLKSNSQYNEYYGDLSISLDTAMYGEAFLANAGVVFISGVLRALLMGLVLYLVYHWLLTRPLWEIIQHLTRVNPDHPGKQVMPLLKGHQHNELGVWVNTINQLLASIERNTHLRREAESTLLRMTQHDFLTGLPNRQQLQTLLSRMLAEAGRSQRRVAVLCVGMDDFKDINEQFGYQTGDQLLQAITDRLQAHNQTVGALARLGGDQFALIQPHIEQPYESAELAQSILDTFLTPFSVGQHSIRLRATIGITLFPEDSDTAEQLLQKAEQTMTLAKTRSRGRYQFYIASVDRQIRRMRELEQDLQEALANNQLYLVYQPQIRYSDHCIVGVEALLRWQHPKHGMIAPDLFIPLAEKNASIIAIGEWVLDQACRQLREWHDLGFSELRIAVNLSTVQLHHAELPQMIRSLLQRHRLAPRSLELEVTETSLMEDINTARQHLLSLRRSGAMIAIDDFGTGYSSLSYLKSLPLDKIKIDKSFVQDLMTDDDDATIVRAIIQLGKSLGMQVIAEGVETNEQEAYIIKEGCHEGQGYLYSKPLSARALSAYLIQGERQRTRIL